jgi:Flp pilus assembly protein TadG
MASSCTPRPSLAKRGQQGQVLIETALVLPLLLFLAFGVIGAGRVTQARMGVDAVAREATRSAALATDAGSALNQGLARGQAVGEGYGLTNGSLQISLSVGQFDPGEQVAASASYTVSFGDLPLLSWAKLTLSSTHLERLDLYRSRWTSGSEP